MPRKFDTVSSYHDVQNVSGIKVMITSAERNWKNLFVYTAQLQPFSSIFPPINSLLISLVLKGNLDGSIQIDSNTFALNLEPGAIIIIPPEASINVNLATSLEVINVYISKSLISDVFDDFSLENGNYLKIDNFLYMYDPFLEQAIELIKDILYVGDRFESLEAQNIARVLVSRIISKYSFPIVNNTNFDNGLPLQTLQKIFDFIEDNLHRRIPIERLAHMAGIGSAQFSRLFKRATNVTLHQYIIKRRVERARDLLAETQLPIAEIAHECGFADQVHLTRFFGRIVGTSPASFRKKLRR